jgi:probable FeS assembly SUF system protein SufT
VTTEKPIALTRDCTAIMIPSGEKIVLVAGSTVWLTQALGGDAEALGLLVTDDLQGVEASVESASGSIEDRVWNELHSCFDPEIPVNIVDLGLIYDCQVTGLADGGHKATVRFTLTAQGCGMGQFLKEDIKKKLVAVPGVREVDVELVWDPPWNQSMISGSAKHQLGIE